MTAYWTLPRIFPAPPTVETIGSMKKRASSFLRELETKDYENVLVACHGGIMRALCGYLDEAPDGLHWERMKNCEIRSRRGAGRPALGAHEELRDPGL